MRPSTTPLLQGVVNAGRLTYMIAMTHLDTSRDRI